jgi:tetratricopeptide (TPR) repeat protein
LPLRAAHDHLRALIALSRGDPDAALSYLERSLRCLAETERETLPFFPVCTVGYSVGEYDGITMPIFEETLLAGRRVGVAQAEAYVLGTVAFSARAAGRLSDAVAALDRSVRIFRSLGDQAGEGYALAQRGHLHRTIGENARAIACLRQSADLRAAIPDQRGSAVSLSGIALAEAQRGNRELAHGLGSEAARMLDRSGDRAGLYGALNNVAMIEVMSGRYGQAIQTVERQLALRSVPDIHPVGWQHLMLAQLRQRTGDSVGAQAALHAATTVFGQIGERDGLAAVERTAMR